MVVIAVHHYSHRVTVSAGAACIGLAGSVIPKGIAHVHALTAVIGIGGDKQPYRCDVAKKQRAELRIMLQAV